ncbi:MAG: enoyl-CoA hydratase-related protein [Bdellovibrionota bacterium]
MTKPDIAILDIPPVLNFRSIASLRERIAEFEVARPSVVIMSSRVPGTFCRGLDLGDSAGELPMFQEVFSSYCQHLEEIQRSCRPVIAVVEGACLGGGLGLAACADLVYAREEATLGLPELWLGLIPGICSVALEARLSQHEIKKLALEAGTVSAREALKRGLVDEVHPDEVSLNQAIEKVARRAKDYTSVSIAALKGLLMETRGVDRSTALAMSREKMDELLQAPETRDLLKRRLEQLECC